MKKIVVLCLLAVMAFVCVSTCLAQSYSPPVGLYPVNPQYNQPAPVSPYPVPNYPGQIYVYPTPVPQYPYYPGYTQPGYNGAPHPGQPQQPPQWQAQPTQISQSPKPKPGKKKDVTWETNWTGEGTINLTWTITNKTGKSWPASNVDILCATGTEWLTNPKRYRWDIPYTVGKNQQLTFTVNIRQPAPGTVMTFKMMDGGDTLYSFDVRP